MTDEKMKILTKADILGAEDFAKETHEVKEWGGSVMLRTLSGKERDEFEARISKASKDGKSIDIRGLKALLLSLALIDGDGNLLFESAEADQLNLKSSKPINDLFEIAQRMNGIGQDAVDELVKN